MAGCTQRALTSLAAHAFANTPISFKKHFLYCMGIWYTCGDIYVLMFMCASAGMCAEVKRQPHVLVSALHLL